VLLVVAHEVLRKWKEKGESYLFRKYTTTNTHFPARKKEKGDILLLRKDTPIGELFPGAWRAGVHREKRLPTPYYASYYASDPLLRLWFPPVTWYMFWAFGF